MDLLDLRPGVNVPDVGAGIGYYALKMARRDTTGGRIYATDIRPEMLRMLRTRAAKAGIRNVMTILGTATDANLPAGQMDLILLVDIYHELSEPQKMLASLARALKPEGRLVLLEG